MRLAEATIDSYRASYGGSGFTGRSEWTIGGYDLRGDVVDALIICPIEAGLAAPFLIVFNSDETTTPALVAERLEDIWDQQVAGDGAAPSETKVIGMIAPRDRAGTRIFRDPDKTTASGRAGRCRQHLAQARQGDLR